MHPCLLFNRLPQSQTSKVLHMNYTPEQYQPNGQFEPINQQGAYYQQQYQTVKKPSSHMVLAIISTFLCGTIYLGVVAIFYAARVNLSWKYGDIEEARRYSRKARNWSIASILVGIVLGLISLIVSFTLGFTSAILDILAEEEYYDEPYYYDSDQSDDYDYYY